MLNEIVESNKSNQLLVGRKISEISLHIKENISTLKKTKDKYNDSKTTYNSLKWYQFIKKSKCKRDMQSAINELTIANSEAIGEIFKILGEILELIFLCFSIPMELIVRMGKWVVKGFEERDNRMGMLTDYVSDLAANNIGSKKENTLNRMAKGAFRLLIFLATIGAIVFVISSIVKSSKSKKLEKPIRNEIENVYLEMPVINNSINTEIPEIDFIEPMDFDVPIDSEIQDNLNSDLIDSKLIEENIFGSEEASVQTENINNYESIIDTANQIAPSDNIANDEENIEMEVNQETVEPTVIDSTEEAIIPDE